MKGNVYRVTYNVIKKEATLYLRDDEPVVIPMSEELWDSMTQGDIIYNFNHFLEELENELDEEMEKEMEKGPYLFDPVTGEKTYLNKNEE